MKVKFVNQIFGPKIYTSKPFQNTKKINSWVLEIVGKVSGARQKKMQMILLVFLIANKIGKAKCFKNFESVKKIEQKIIFLEYKKI